MALVRNDVAFGLENLGTAPEEIWPRVDAALDALGAAHLAGRRTNELSGGELQRVCLAAALAVRPGLVLLDEPTSQLDPDATARLLAEVEGSGAAVVLSEQRTERALSVADRVLFLEDGRLLLDARAATTASPGSPSIGRTTCRPSPPPTLTGPSRARSSRAPRVCRSRTAPGSRCSTAPLSRSAAARSSRSRARTARARRRSRRSSPACSIPTPARSKREGRAGLLLQDPGRYLACERVLDEVALGAHDESEARRALGRVGLAWAEDRHPRDLSSGERERLGLAAVAVGEPDLLVLDEPTRGVDPDRKAALAEWLFAYAAEGRAVLVATHDRTFPAHRRVEIGAVREEEPVAV